MFGEAMSRLQCFPADVIPLQVVAGFFESDLRSWDSGVPGTNGMVVDGLDNGDGIGRTERRGKETEVEHCHDVAQKQI